MFDFYNKNIVSIDTYHIAFSINIQSIIVDTQTNYTLISFVNVAIITSGLKRVTIWQIVVQG